MAVRIYKPTTAGRRVSSVQDFSDITKKTPEKSLVRILKKKSGRNNTGHITVRHQGSGVKRLYRAIDFKQALYDVEAKVIAIEYDPNRGARLALVEYTTGQKAYVIAPLGMKVGDTVLSSQKQIEPKLGMRMPLEYIPTGIFVHNVELESGKGGQMARGAGTGVQLMVIEGKYAQLKMPSGEVRMVALQSLATIGSLGNEDIRQRVLGKAGRSRHMGIKPTVRGVAQDPDSHPHGGGEGRSPEGMPPKTPWGKPARGFRTRNKDKWSKKFIVSRRKK